MKEIRVLIDADGGDFAPKEQVLGTLQAMKEHAIKVIFLGDEEKIKKCLAENKHSKEKIKIINCQEKIETEESPVKAIRHKKDSSIVKAMGLLKNGDADAFISSGNTGAVLAGGILLNGRIKGIDRPGLTTVLPTVKTGCVMLDLGANSFVRAENLNEFATMGSMYAKNFLKIDKPKVGLLNIGSEEGKGTKMVQEAYRLLKDNKYINFVGNAEAREILTGKFDVIVADGFSGNIALKAVEGTAITLIRELKKSLMASTISKMGAFLSKSAFKKVKKMLDYEEYGGAVLLGINDIVIKAHGSSNAKAFKNAIRQAVMVKESGVLEEIKEFAREK